MDFALSDREQELWDAFGKFFAQESPTATVRAAEPGGFDARVWSAAVGLGVPAMALPAADGGATFVELALLCELAGRALAPVPLVETLCCLRALSRVRDQAPAATAASVDAAVTAATAASAASVDAAVTDLCAGAIGTVALHPAAGGDGRQMVPAGAVADIVLVAAGDALVLARAGDDRVQSFPRVHGSSPVAAWDLRRRTGDTVLVEEGGEDIRRGARDEWKILTAASLMGLARRALEIGAEYATGRRAFGTPIGSFQGVAHPLADAATEIDGGTLLVRRAAWLVDQAADEEAAHLARLAWGFCGPVATATTARCVHI
ncbi:MAG TPA: acyl-CoA dehydrogenase, partial [Acidimicrobiales bacterium]|nr:acyl-CoA dehydrogenase [Acidimicrobiales bacterium]